MAAVSDFKVDLVFVSAFVVGFGLALFWRNLR